MSTDFFRVRTIRIIGFLVAVTTVLASCRTTSVQPVVEQKDPVEGLVFLTFVMRQDSVTGTDITLVSKTIVHQKLKAAPPNSGSANRLWITQLNNAGKKLSSVAIDHPLIRRVEFTNDQGQFQSKEIQLKDAEFFVRVTLYTEAVYVQVEEELAGKITHSTRLNLKN